MDAFDYEAVTLDQKAWVTKLKNWDFENQNI
jgi:hypothetical protein